MMNPRKYIVTDRQQVISCCGILRPSFRQWEDQNYSLHQFLHGTNEPPSLVSLGMKIQQAIRLVR